jgi:pimeloyl-ACP methyl ester carboxylesterase
MPFLDRDGRRIHYTETGAGPGVLLVPGLGSGSRQFGTLPRRFARAGFTCAVLDPVGLPPSGPLGGGFSFAAAADDALAVLARLPRPASLVGTSLGGKVALLAAAKEPGLARRLVLVCSSAVPTARARRLHRWFGLLAESVDPALLGELTAPFLFGATFQARKPGLVDDIVRSSDPGPEALALMRSQVRALLEFDGTAAARGCTVPALCLAGAEDTLTPPADVEATARLLARGSYQAVPGAGHSLLLESGAAFARVVAFLRA